LTFIKNQWIRRRIAALLACGLIVSLLPGFAATRDMSTREALAEGAVSTSQIHHREHNLLLDATLSGNMDSFNKGLRRFDGGDRRGSAVVQATIGGHDRDVNRAGHRSFQETWNAASHSAIDGEGND
jgi:hypothetical protein